MGLFKRLLDKRKDKERYQKLNQRQKDILEKAYAVMVREDEWQKDLDSFCGQELNYRIIEGLLRQVGNDKVVVITMKDGAKVEIRSKSNAELLEEYNKRPDPYVYNPRNQL